MLFNAQGENMGTRDRKKTQSAAVSRGPHTQGRRAAIQLLLLLRGRRELRRSYRARDVTPDPLDVAKEAEEEQLWLVVLDRRAEVREQIGEAVELLRTGRYGWCVECDMPIPMARLQALPFAVRCVACQERFEARSGQAAVNHGGGRRSPANSRWV